MDVPNDKSPNTNPGSDGQLGKPDPETPPPADPFADISALRLSQDFASGVGVKKLLVTVPVRKPHRQWFVRVHPDESHRLQTAVLELKEERETYIVDPSLWSALPGEIVPMAIYTAINRQGVVFLWPIRLPGEDGRQIEWHRSALEAADRACRSWVRLAASFSLGAYEVSVASAELPEPLWPEQSFQDLLRIGFRDRYINSMDHPVVKSLRGEM